MPSADSRRRAVDGAPKLPTLAVMRSLRLLLCASEVTPFAKTGGLADVAAGLARWLGSVGHDVRVFLPLYKRILDGAWDLQPVPGAEAIEVRFPTRSIRFG
ncbi:MAG: hypothetical protein RL398_1831, partial [Planctomycetota bacterium]